MFKVGDHVFDKERNFGRGVVINVIAESLYDPFTAEVQFKQFPEHVTHWYTSTGAFFRSSAPTLEKLT